MTGPEIAQQLFMSVKTFRTHSRHIFTKLDVRTTRSAVLRAAELDLLQVELTRARNHKPGHIVM
jgi:LuxR family maltose regulon positive regulatory protein